jgi:hypothetical protein
MMYGKHFKTMYGGSMVGAGACVFALMGYIIANQEPDRKVGSQVRLNPMLLSTIFGESVAAIEKAIGFLCAPDPKSSSPEQGGRRLIKVGQFDYQVVTGAKYMAIRNGDERRESNRDAKRRERAKKGTPVGGEATYDKLHREEGQEAADRFQDGMQSTG